MDIAWVCLGMPMYSFSIALVLLVYAGVSLGYLVLLGYCPGISWVLLGFYLGIALVSLGYARVCSGIAWVFLGYC